jgi:predicted amidophosphoribosyltransferase
MRNQWKLLCTILWPEPVDAIRSPGGIQKYKDVYFIVPYKDATVKNTVRNNKFHYHKQSAQQLATILDQSLSRYSNPTIIPIPSSRTRTRKRGYQHLLNILQYSTYQTAINNTVLQKLTNTPSQSHVSKEIRLKQQLGTFRCNQQAARNLSGPVILLDDVVTTGATMHAAQAALIPHLSTHTHLICLAIAH